MMFKHTQETTTRVYLVHLVDATGVVQQTLGDRGLSRVDVSGDADVAHHLQLLFGTARRVQGDAGGPKLYDERKKLVTENERFK